MKLNPPRFLFCFAFLCGQLIPSPATSACIPSCDANVRHEVCKDSQCVCDDDYVRLNGNCVKKPVDPTLCLSYPCMNGGNCTAESATVFNCTCADGYEGRTCEKEVLEMCSEERCLNGGTCQRNSSGSSCMCTYGYEGDHCEIKVECADFLLDEYQPKCNPNATCVFTPGNFNESICICNSSFTGNGTHCVQIIEIKNNTTDITTEISPTSTSTAVSTSSGGSDATREATTSTSTSTSKVGIIVGVVCGLAAIALVCICLFLWYRSRRGTLDIPTSNSKFYDTHQYATVRFETDNKGCGGIVAEDTSPAKLSALYETMHDPRLQKKTGANTYEEPTALKTNNGLVESTVPAGYDKPATIPSVIDPDSGYYVPNQRVKSGSQLSATQSEDGYEEPVHLRLHPLHKSNDVRK